MTLALYKLSDAPEIFYKKLAYNSEEVAVAIEAVFTYRAPCRSYVQSYRSRLLPGVVTHETVRPAGVELLPVRYVAAEKPHGTTDALGSAEAGRATRRGKPHCGRVAVV